MSEHEKRLKQIDANYDAEELKEENIRSIQRHLDMNKTLSKTNLLEIFDIFKNISEPSVPFDENKERYMVSVIKYQKDEAVRDKTVMMIGINEDKKADGKDVYYVFNDGLIDKFIEEFDIILESSVPYKACWVDYLNHIISVNMTHALAFRNFLNNTFELKEIPF